MGASLDKGKGKGQKDKEEGEHHLWRRKKRQRKKQRNMGKMPMLRDGGGPLTKLGAAVGGGGYAGDLLRG